MSKQKSYMVTDLADEQLGQLAERNGLAKSATLELLIRQAYAANWSAIQAATPIPDVRPRAYLKDIPMSTRLSHVLWRIDGLDNFFDDGSIYNGQWKHRNWMNTIQEVAELGKRALKKRSGMGVGTLQELENICQNHGCPLAS